MKNQLILTGVVQLKWFEMEIIFIYAILLSILAATIWNLAILHRIKKISKKGDSHLKEDKYWELKHKLQLYLTIVGIIVALFAILGYETYKDFQDRIDIALNESANKIDSISNNYENEIYNYISRFNELEKKGNNIKGNLNFAEIEIIDIKEQIGRIDGLAPY